LTLGGGFALIAAATTAQPIRFEFAGRRSPPVTEPVEWPRD